jgi:hypothetical protein
LGGWQVVSTVGGGPYAALNGNAAEDFYADTFYGFLDGLAAEAQHAQMATALYTNVLGSFINYDDGVASWTTQGAPFTASAFIGDGSGLYNVVAFSLDAGGDVFYYDDGDTSTYRSNVGITSDVGFFGGGGGLTGYAPSLAVNTANSAERLSTSGFGFEYDGLDGWVFSGTLSGDGSGLTGVTAVGSTFPTFFGNGLLTVVDLGAVSGGSRAVVSDALAPVFGAAVVGGGAVKVPVYYDGTIWRVG